MVRPQKHTLGRSTLKRRFRGNGTKLFSDLHHAEAERLDDALAHRSFAVQNHVEVNTINAVTLCKSDLIALAFYCGSQQLNDFIIIKYQRLTAQFAQEPLHRVGSKVILSAYRYEVNGTVIL